MQPSAEENPKSKRGLSSAGVLSSLWCAHLAAQALLALGLTLVLAGVLFGTGGLGFGHGLLGVGGVGTASWSLALVGVGRRGARLRRLSSFVAIALPATALIVLFPPRWLLGLLNSPETRFLVASSERVVALSIDDSLDPQTTPLILEVLARHDVRATFFLLSDTVEKNEALVRSLVEAGHELGNHQTRDLRGWRMSRDEFAEDVQQAGRVLSKFAEVRWLRPGGGATTRAMWEEAEQQGYQVVLGSVFPFDSHVPSERFAAAYLKKRAFPGAILVLHDGGDRGRRTARVLDEVLPQLKEQGYRIITVGRLIDSAGG